MTSHLARGLVVLSIWVLNQPVERAFGNDGPTPVEAIRAPSEVEAGRREAVELRAATGAALRTRMADSESGVAVRAAFERLRRATQKKKSKRTDVSPPKEARHRFVGLLEGRLGFFPPKPWEKTLLTAKLRNGAEWVFHLQHEPSWYLTAGGLRTRPEIRISKTDGGFIAQIDEQSMQFSSSLLESYKLAGEQFNMLFDTDRCYAAFHSEHAAPYRVGCFDRKARQLLWISEIRPDLRASCRGGSGEQLHYTWLVIDDGILYIFGAGTNGVMYYEGVNLKDGRLMHRFSAADYERPM